MMVVAGCIQVLSSVYFVYMLKKKTRTALPLTATLGVAGNFSNFNFHLF